MAFVVICWVGEPEVAQHDVPGLGLSLRMGKVMSPEQSVLRNPSRHFGGLSK